MAPLFKLPRSPTYSALDILTLFTPNIFSRTRADVLWKTVRKAVAKVFTPSHLSSHYPAAYDLLDRFVTDRWAPKASAGEAVDMIEDLPMVLMHILGIVGFELDLARPERESQLRALLAAMDDTMEEVHLRSTDPLRPLCVWRSDVRRHMSRTAEWNTLIREFAQEALSSARANGSDRDSARSIVAALAHTRMPDGKLLPARQAAAEVATFVFVGTDTTKHTLAWTLYLLALHPACRRKIAHELEAHGIKDKAGGGVARKVAFKDLHQLTYINACLQESMRLEPTVAIGTWRQADRDMHVGPHFVPRGSLLGLPFLAAFTDESNFPEGLRFDPDRWLSSDQSNAQATSNLTVSALEGNTHHATNATVTGCPFAGQGSGKAPPAQASFPFSVGDRNCVGRALAQMEMSMFMARLFAQYDVELAMPAEAAYEGEVFRATSAPAKLLVRLRPW